MSFFFSPFGVALPFGVDGDLRGLFSPLFLFSGLSSRLPAGLLNTIIFCLALSQREGQSYAFSAKSNQKDQKGIIRQNRRLNGFKGGV